MKGKCLLCGYEEDFEGKTLKEATILMDDHSMAVHKSGSWIVSVNPVDGVDPQDWMGDPAQRKWVIEGE